MRRIISLPVTLVTALALGASAFALAATQVTLTNGDDVYTGPNGAQEVFGLQGKDNIDGGQGNDIMHGDPGADLVKGSNDDDELDGGVGNDELRGNSGLDLYEGGGGDDILVGTNSASSNILRGDSDDDVIDARNGSNGDVVDGGGGMDTCKFDSTFERDQAERCEIPVVGP